MAAKKWTKKTVKKPRPKSIYIHGDNLVNLCVLWDAQSPGAATSVKLCDGEDDAVEAVDGGAGLAAYRL